MFCISQVIISISFNAEIFKAILTESLYTTEENVREQPVLGWNMSYLTSLFRENIWTFVIQNLDKKREH